MSLTILCIVVASFYGAILFFDSFFKSCIQHPYLAFLEGTGLKFGFFNFSWTTTAFNRLIFRWGQNLSRVLKPWFTWGYIVTTCLFLPFTLWTLYLLVFNHFHDKAESSHMPEVKVMMPGVNIPASDFWAYFCAIGLSSVIHEFGHALAATQEDVQILSAGVYVFTIVPIAFVQINSDHLNSLEISKRLRIYCAGVWHNIATSLFALLIYLSTPLLFFFAYQSGDGLLVLDLHNDSPFKDVRGLEVGDVLISINNCVLNSMYDWSYCIHKAHDRYGICTSAEYIAKHDEVNAQYVKENDIVECCRNDDLFGFCFEYMEPKPFHDQMPNQNSVVLPNQYSCLKPRDMVKHNYKQCTEIDGYACPFGMHCMKPSLYNSTYLLAIGRKGDNTVLYLGTPQDISNTVFVDQYLPRAEIFSVFTPSSFEKFWRYIFIFSMGIGFINVLPCYGTDGHHIARNLIQMLAIKFKRNAEFVSVLTILTVIVGTGVTVPMLLYLFYEAINNQT